MLHGKGHIALGGESVNLNHEVVNKVSISDNTIGYLKGKRGKLSDKAIFAGEYIFLSWRNFPSFKFVGCFKFGDQDCSILSLDEEKEGSY